MSDPTLLVRVVLRALALIALAVTSAVLADYVGPRSAFCEPGGGCEVVRYWAMQNDLGAFLPVFGLAAFTAVFAGTLAARRGTVRWTAIAAIAGGVIAIGLIVVQAVVIETFCSLCVAIDATAIAAGLVGAVLLVRSSRAPVGGPIGMRNPAWALWAIATFAPMAWPLTSPDPSVPDAVRRRWREGAVNVVEFIDFECPHCRAMHPILRGAIAQSSAEVVVHRGVLSFHGSDIGARAHFCAEEQDRAEPLADRMIVADDLSREGVIGIARQLNLDVDAFTRCLDAPTTTQGVRAYEQFAREAGVSGVPTVWIGERTFLGFDPDDGAAPFRDALAAAARGEGARRDLRWYAALLVFAVVIAAWGWMKDRRGLGRR